MKYLVLLGLLVLAYAVWRNSQRRVNKTRPPAAPGRPQDMVRCPVCAVHLPRGEALPGPDGQLYCSQEHRLRAGS